MENAIGENAGKIWDLLSKKGPQAPSSMSKVLGLKTADVDRALGWLSREGKLAFAPDGKGGTKVSLR